MLIKIDTISKIYTMGSGEVSALNEVSLSIHNNEYLSIMGPSGSGKSTLMNIIGCLDKPERGEYILNDLPVSKMSDDQLAAVRNRTIGFVFQTFNLLASLSALENVSLPMLYAGIPPPIRKKIATASLQRVGLSERLLHKPSELSGGERQRVAIARALVNTPPLILADEPTGNLDSDTGEQVLTLFDELFSEGKTIILITHDQKVGMHAKRFIRLKDGRIERDETA